MVSRGWADERVPRGTGLLATAVVAMLLVLLPASAEAAVEPRGIDRVCPAPADASPGNTAPFPDAGTTHAPAIQCAADYGLISGRADGTYGPNAPLTRAQMATVLRGFIETATGAPLPAPAPDPFVDIAGSIHRDSIRAVAAAGVVSGRADGTYGPGATVTRGQMARFIVGALDRIVDPDVSGSFPPAAEANDFDDVPGTTFQAEIRALAAVGVVGGTSATTYEPSAPVTRGQLATFLMRAADLLAEEEAWEPTQPVEIDVNVVLTGEAVRGSVDGQIVTGQGQPGATASATLVFDPRAGSVSFGLDYAEVFGPFDAARGFLLEQPLTGVQSRIVLELATGQQLQDRADGGGARTISGTLSDLDVRGNDVEAAVREILANPSGYYLTVRSNEYSSGAVRGQLPAR